MEEIKKHSPPHEERPDERLTFIRYLMGHKTSHFDFQSNMFKRSPDTFKIGGKYYTFTLMAEHIEEFLSLEMSADEKLVIVEIAPTEKNNLIRFLAMRKKPVVIEKMSYPIMVARYIVAHPVHTSDGTNEDCPSPRHRITVHGTQYTCLFETSTLVRLPDIPESSNGVVIEIHPMSSQRLRKMLAMGKSPPVKGVIRSLAAVRAASVA